MSSPSNLRERIFAKLDELQYLYDTGQIAPDSSEYLDLLALQEFEWVLSYIDAAENHLALFQTSETLH